MLFLVLTIIFSFVRPFFYIFNSPSDKFWSFKVNGAFFLVSTKFLGLLYLG
jgi:hypothetical protein